MREQIHVRNLCIYLAGELLIMCNVCFGGADVGLVLWSDRLGSPLNFDLHLRNLLVVRGN